jgi:hypothetical protein
VPEADVIQPYAGNPFYWQYRGEPVLLLGGSAKDNLFQLDGLAEHLDLLRSVGGNYVRCTMSSREPGHIWPYAREEDLGLYDLNRFDDDYWGRFARMVELTGERDVIMQVEFWATWDLYSRCWHKHPYNPRNNVNYTAAQTGMPEAIDYPPPADNQMFHRTVPALADVAEVRRFQEAFVDKVLSYTLDRGHVLYCMDNETNAHPEWGAYWARYVRGKAEEAGRPIYITEMWDNWDPSDGEVPGARMQDEHDHPFLHRSNVKVTLAHPELYDFVDISNHNTQIGRTHYETAMWVRQQVAGSGHIRPINCVKMYGGDPSRDYAGPARWGEERFWRNVFAGVSAVRFHRPPSGLGLNDAAQAHLRSMRMLTDRMDVFRCEPRDDLLSGRGDMEAYCLANPGVEYAVCFLDGGEAMLNASAAEDGLEVRWLDVKACTWRDRETAAAGSVLLRPPGPGFWAACVQPS